MSKGVYVQGDLFKRGVHGFIFVYDEQVKSWFKCDNEEAEKVILKLEAKG